MSKLPCFVVGSAYIVSAAPSWTSAGSLRASLRGGRAARCAAAVENPAFKPMPSSRRVFRIRAPDPAQRSFHIVAETPTRREEPAPSALDAPLIVDVEPEDQDTVQVASEFLIGPILAVVFISMLDAAGFSFVKILDNDLAPSLSTALRFSVASIGFLPYLWKHRNDMEAFLAGGELGLWLFAGFAFQSLALQTVEASRSAFISSLDVVIVPMVEWLVFRYRLGVRTWVAALVACVGVIALETGGMHGPEIGDLFSVLMATCWAINFIRLEEHGHKHSATLLSAVELCATSVLCLGWFIAERPAVDLSTIPWPTVAVAGLGLTALPTWMSGAGRDACCGRAACRRPSWEGAAFEATVVLSLEPLWAAGLAFVLLGETLASQAYLGGLLIVLACLLHHLIPETEKK